MNGAITGGTAVEPAAGERRRAAPARGPGAAPVAARPAIDAVAPAGRRAFALRTALVAGGIVAVIVALALGVPAPGPAADPTLATLLRGMAAIKALLAAAAFALVAWRLGHLIGVGRAAVCIVAVAAMAGATAAIAALASIVPAAIAFHVGLVALAIAGWHDDAVVRPRLARAVPAATTRGTRIGR